jgi:fructose-bisphosphate aldolase class II
MPLAPMRQLLEEAIKGGYGVGAFNVNNMEQIQAIVGAAAETKSPVIIQASKGALQYTSLVYLKHLMMAAVEDNPGVPVALHLDHGSSFDWCKQAIELGFTSVMMDGSLEEDGKTVASYEYNVEITRKVVEFAHARGVTVEAELGTLGGIEDGHGSGEVHLTDPDQAVDFVKQTGCDCLALAIGTSHGAYKSMNIGPDGTVQPPTLAVERIVEIHKRMPEVPLVMHGSSSVPQELIAEINKHGGEMKQAYGIPMEQIQEGIRQGVRKINVDTDGRLAVTATIRRVFAEDPGEFDPRKYLGPAREALRELIAGKMRDFGQAGHAEDFEPMTLDDMKRSYQSAQA